MRTHLFRAFASAAVVFTLSCGQSVQNDGRIDAVLQKAVDAGDIVGVVAMAATSDGVVYQGAFGKRDRTAGVDMTLDSIFRIASMTKAVTSVAAMQLVEEGAIQLDEPVSRYIPDFSPQLFEGFDESSGKPQFRRPTSSVTVRQLLTHTAGFGYEMWNPLLRDAVAQEVVPSLYSGGDSFLLAPLVFEPGSRWHYGISTDWLGRLVETVRGDTLDEVFRTHIFEPLGMKDTDFDLPADKELRLVQVSHRRDGGVLVEADRRPPSAPAFFSGGHGLLSTGPDYLRFLQMFVKGGSLDSARILKPETVALMAENHIGDLEAGAMKTAMPEISNDFDFFPGSSDRFGLGFLLNTDSVAGGRSAGSLAWAGMNNSYYWVDLDLGVAGVLMVQVRPFFDKRVVQLLENFERAVYEAPTAAR
jgi:CubicO group peptidase (beta-lactamase class C family)